MCVKQPRAVACARHRTGHASTQFVVAEKSTVTAQLVTPPRALQLELISCCSLVRCLLDLLQLVYSTFSRYDRRALVHVSILVATLLVHEVRCVCFGAEDRNQRQALVGGRIDVAERRA